VGLIFVSLGLALAFKANGMVAARQPSSDQDRM